jgi:aryl-alcohol dehydrogenase-like predicted oxidoreductase
MKYSNAAPGSDPNAAGNHRKSMMQAVEASLKRLQTDYIDLYWVHIWDGITPVEEVMQSRCHSSHLVHPAPSAAL